MHTERSLCLLSQVKTQQVGLSYMDLVTGLSLHCDAAVTGGAWKLVISHSDTLRAFLTEPMHALGCGLMCVSTTRPSSPQDQGP